MPIQPYSSNKGYQQIPDVEDVSPIDGSTPRATQKSTRFNYIVVSLILLAIMFAAYFILHYNTNGLEDIKIYETSMSKPGGLRLLSSTDLRSYGTNLKNIKFGNTVCFEDKCSDIKPSPSKLSVDSTKKFQKIIGFGGAFTGLFILCFILYI
jgi:hypothetical protein